MAPIQVAARDHHELLIVNRKPKGWDNNDLALCREMIHVWYKSGLAGSGPRLSRRGNSAIIPYLFYLFFRCRLLGPELKLPDPWSDFHWVCIIMWFTSLITWSLSIRWASSSAKRVEPFSGSTLFTTVHLVPVV